MNSKINIITDKQMQLEVSKMRITKDVIEDQKGQCEDLFELWQMCVKSNSWNNSECFGKFKPDYELCIRKKNLMQTMFEESRD